MKVPERTRKMAKIYEMDAMSNYELLLTKSTRKKKSAKKADASPVKMSAKKVSATTVAVPEPTLTRAESKKCDQLARTGSVTHKWQYVGDSGKWQDYDKNASDLVEIAYASWQMNPEIDVRAVSSGDWAYQVDFNQMTQTNVRHAAHKKRKIQRVPRL